MKRKIRSFIIGIAKAAAFFALLLLAITGVSRVVERKASRVQFDPFLKTAGEYDVLFVGDSHMYNSIFPMELWQDYGIASYNISCYGNTVPVSYWNLMNALDYASPKLVVVGIKDVDKTYKVSGSSADVHTALDAFPLTPTKVRSIEDLMDDPYAMDDEGNAYTDLRWEYYFKLAKYHARWSDLGSSDFSVNANVQKGGGMKINVAEPSEHDLVDEWETLPEDGWGFVYLRKIVEECQQRGIDVLLTHLAYPADTDDQMAAHTVIGIAQEYGVDYIDFVSMDCVADYYVDCFDKDSHINPSGARKVTDFMGRYIMTHYDVSDRREDPDLAHWTDEYQTYTDYKVNHLRAQANAKNLDNLLMLLHDDSFRCEIYIPAGSDVYYDDRQLTLVHNIVREHVFEENPDSLYSSGIFPLDGLEEAYAADEDYFLDAVGEGGAFEEFVAEDALVCAQEVFGEMEPGVSLRVRVTRAGDGQEVLKVDF